MRGDRADLLRRFALARLAVLVSAALAGGAASDAAAQLRVVNYNTATGNSSPGYAGRSTDFNRVLDFIGREEINGIAKPIDVLILQEQSDAGSAASFAAELNLISGTSDYVAWSQNPFGTDGLDAGFVYNSATVTPFLEDWFGTGSSRATGRIGLNPVGYTNAALYIYSTHHTAGTGGGDYVERRNEAFDLRLITGDGQTNSGPSGTPFGGDSLPADANIIYAGDFNQRSSYEEPSSDPYAWASNPYQILQLGPSSGFGAGEAVDPIAAPGNWHNNFSFASIHTQSPHDGSFGLVTGGMDDRFDFQMVSTELNDGEGLSYIGPNAGDSQATAESYHTFGNNGTNYNQAASSSSNTGLDWIISQGETLPGMTSTQTRNAVRSSLARASDHSPVVADYQLPAVLSAIAGAVPPTLALGQAFDLNVAVSNAAAVLTSLGADELEYTLSVSGDLNGGAAGSDSALGGVNNHLVALDTSTAGAKLGTITVATASQSAENALIEIPISFDVIAALLGDTDSDGDLDADDIDTLYANLGSGDSLFDLDMDGGLADQQDVDTLVHTILGTEYGDLNLDKQIDIYDISTVSGSFGLGGGWAGGDMNGDSVIDIGDYSTVSGNFGFVASSNAVSVPEPDLALLLLLGIGITSGSAAASRRL
ncbi:hypothetical protein Mal64_30640 [Pseudobythopirellula maris]|uniref:Endonuclease/Exonuclease/phosphatase family protein n=2 Tax=Pseudobythopirellula maris TaxID=2527991 RepID=A0A5C5ZM59_9BACT|nr:hypothetical protein Mal64_30640 [Pseudobythopirellula maris]